MTLTIVWSQAAGRELRALDKVVAKRVRKAILRFAETGHGDIKKLQGADELRLRVGDWRVRMTVNATTRELFVMRVLKRSEAYR